MSFELSARYFEKPIEPKTLGAKTREFVEHHSAALNEALGRELYSQSDVEGTKWPHPRDFLLSYLKRFGFQIDRRALMTMERDDEFEIWTSDFKLLGCSGGFMKLCTYSLEELMQNDWSELFTRPAEIHQQIMTALSTLNKENRLVENVTDWHPVVETKSKSSRSAQIRVKSFSLATSPSGEVAFIALTKVRAH